MCPCVMIFWLNALDIVLLTNTNIYTIKAHSKGIQYIKIINYKNTSLYFNWLIIYIFNWVNTLDIKSK